MKNKVTEVQKIDVEILQKYGKIIEKFQKYIWKFNEFLSQAQYLILDFLLLNYNLNGVGNLFQKWYNS